MSLTTERVLESLIGCSKCNRMLYPGHFDVRTDTGRQRRVCRECRITQINHWQEVNREQTRTNQRRYNRTFRGRAIILLNAAKARAVKRGEDFTIELDDVMSLLAVGVCAKTGVKFEYENSVGGTQSPYAPSLDKINADGIYERDNIQIVCFWYNGAKQQWPEYIIIEMCRNVVRMSNALPE